MSDVERERTVVRIPSPLKRQLESSAQTNRRSLGRELQTILEQHFAPQLEHRDVRLRDGH